MPPVRAHGQFNAPAAAGSRVAVAGARLSVLLGAEVFETFHGGREDLNCFFGRKAHLLKVGDRIGQQVLVAQRPNPLRRRMRSSINTPIALEAKRAVVACGWS